MLAPPFFKSRLNPSRRKSRLVFGSYLPLLTAAFLTACKTGPDYHRPAPLGPTPMPSAYATSIDTNHPGWKTATPSAQLPRGTWWLLFGDVELNRLENVASSNNFELAAALARFEQARAQVNISRAELFP